MQLMIIENGDIQQCEEFTSYSELICLLKQQGFWVHYARKIGKRLQEVWVKETQTAVITQLDGEL